MYVFVRDDPKFVWPKGYSYIKNLLGGCRDVTPSPDVRNMTFFFYQSFPIYLYVFVRAMCKFVRNQFSGNRGKTFWGGCRDVTPAPDVRNMTFCYRGGVGTKFKSLDWNLSCTPYTIYQLNYWDFFLLSPLEFKFFIYFLVPSTYNNTQTFFNNYLLLYVI